MSAKEVLIHNVAGGMSITEAAELHEVARSCAYKWVARYRQFGKAGLEELSRAPEYSPGRTPEAIIDELLVLKKKYPHFGPAKLATLLEQRHKKRVIASSTAGEILSRHGLVKKNRPRQRHAGPIEHPPFVVAGGGHSMTTDYKGQFRTRNGRPCYPLTIADPYSRYVFAIEAMASTAGRKARTVFERVFREHGVPSQMISDNGTPFSIWNSLGGLTQLSRWWIELGIVPVRIQPGHPQQNGIHERMHRTLKDWIVRSVQSDLRTQQPSFEEFRAEFNHIRPHQGLGQKTPASMLKAYRPFPSRLEPLTYDTAMKVRSVRSNGQIKWNGTLIFVSEVLIGANVGLLEIDEALWAIYYGAVRIGYLDGFTNRVHNQPRKIQSKSKDASNEETKPSADSDDAG